jgi:lysozyme
MSKLQLGIQINEHPLHPHSNPKLVPDPNALNDSHVSWVRMVFIYGDFRNVPNTGGTIGGYASHYTNDIRAAVENVDKTINNVNPLKQHRNFIEDLQTRSPNTRVLVIINYQTLQPVGGSWASNDWALYSEMFGHICRKIAEGFRGLRLAYEIWNEPDMFAGASVHVDPTNFARVVVAAYENIKAVDATLNVVLGGLVGGPDVGGEYVKNILSSDSVRDFRNRWGAAALPFDAVGIHPYKKYAGDAFPAWFSEQDKLEWGHIRHTLFEFKRRLPANIPMWVTECGVAQYTEQWYGDVAIYMDNLVNFFADHPEYNIPVVIWFSYADGGGETAGIVTQNGDAKPHIFEQFFELAEKYAIESSEEPPQPLLDMKFVSDITIPDNQELEAGSQVEKIWLLRNSGNAAWPDNTLWVQINRRVDDFPDAQRIEIDSSAIRVAAVDPDTEFELKLSFTVPSQSGTYYARFQLETPNGQRFGQTPYLVFKVINLDDDNPHDDSIDDFISEMDDYPVLVIDLSHHQSRVNFDAAKDFGIKAILHKATESISFLDSRYHERKQIARNIGLLWGAYHFGSDADPAAQVEHLLSSALPDGQTVYALDLESKMTMKQAVSFVRIFQNRTGKFPLFYTSASKYNKAVRLDNTPLTEEELALLQQCPLWVAHYTTIKSPTLPVAWQKTSWLLWQFTSNEPHVLAQGAPEFRIPNFTSQSHDVNRYHGTVKQLEQLWQNHIVAAL